MKASSSRPRTLPGRSRCYIVELSTFEGEDTACYLLGADPMWIVISAHPTTGASIVDLGYRSLKEAHDAWPEAIAPARSPRGRDRHRPVGWNGVPPVFSEPWFQAAWKKEKRQRARPAR